MSVDDKEMQTVFLDEVSVLLSGINTQLAILEKDPTDADSINVIFRNTHTLKGIFASVNLTGGSKLCHVAEDALIRIQKTNFVDSDALDILFAFLNNLENFSTFLTENFANKDLMENVNDQFNFSVIINDFENMLNNVLNLGNKYRLVVTISPDCSLKGARAYQVLRVLEDISKIIESKPTKAEIEEGEVFSHLELIIYSQEEDFTLREHVNKVDEISNVQVETLFDEKDIKDSDKPERSPTAIKSVRVQLYLLDQMMDLLGELIIERNALAQHVSLQGLETQLFSQMDRSIVDLRRIILKTRLVPLQYIFEHFPRLVREATRESEKKVKLIISGKFVEIDRTSIDYLNEALIHLIRNAIHHGIETPSEREDIGKPSQGIIQVQGKIDQNEILITVEDDGRGIDVDSVRKKAESEGFVKKGQKIDREGLIALLFLSGFSTSEKVTNLAGRGIGLNIAFTNIVDKLNGSINAVSEKGAGTRFILRIPTLLSIVDALLVEVQDEQFTIPLSNIQQIYNVTADKIFYHNNKSIVVINKKLIPVVSIKERFKLAFENEVEKTDNILIIWEQAGKQVGVLVDSIVSQQQIVLKSMDKLMSAIKGFSGFTLIGQGTIVPVLDPGQLLEV